MTDRGFGERFGIDLYWFPLGAGGNFVRLNGRIYEAIKARLDTSVGDQSSVGSPRQILDGIDRRPVNNGDWVAILSMAVSCSIADARQHRQRVHAHPEEVARVDVRVCRGRPPRGSHRGGDGGPTPAHLV
jgi:hypothetical protein